MAEREEFVAVSTHVEMSKGKLLDKIFIQSIWRSQYPKELSINEEALEQIIDEMRKELEKGFIADKANFTCYKSYRKFLEWFGDKKDEEETK